ncbi:ferric-rhodotorulic acid/ferric-coprogen receptor FhuE [uncultured Azohydromonas sp.]|jgi:TonB-dependent siderophore receptor|uniref:ferric-rhodotorulic acid/ferric-coprogen receptor FhuE n=1 Tax=uncultured Azohydromonas sp. TaxID=487342 RepID=UPI002601A393|nr:ferric-rhodotorulic acid/ferric-coprogen receptor FhuE [uncultured Azohydromonas sp.]
MHDRVSGGRFQRRPHRLKPIGVGVLLALQGAAWAQADEAPEASLPAVVAKEQAPRATTEGTRSYTTRQAGTATPLGLPLRDTPQSASVVTQQRIEDQALRTVLDVVDNATGVSARRFETNRVDFSSRGFQVRNLMIDGVPTTWDTTWSAGEAFGSLAPYDRVEIVRGATGLTSGTGDPSAAINLVRKRADSRTFSGSAELGVGRWDQRRGMVDLSAPLNDSGSVRARVVGEYQRSDSWIDLKRDESKTLYATLSADLTPRTRLSVGLSRQDSDTDSPMWGGLPYWHADGSLADWPRSKTTAARWARWDSEHETLFADLEHRFGNGWKARASLNRGDRQGDTPLLYMYGAPDRVTGLGLNTWPGWYRNRTRQDDVGLNVSGPWRLAGRVHEAGFGYAYSKNRFNADSRTAPFGVAGDFNAWDGSYPEPDWSPWAFYQKDRTEQHAAYGVVRLNVADPLRVILGARVTNYEKTGVDADGSTLYRMKFARELTPYVGAIYDLNDTYSFYASHTGIFQPQRLRDINGRYLDPVVGKNTEAGIKGELLDGRLNAALAVFRIEQDKLGQATALDVPGGSPGEKAYVESQGATSKGFEIEVTGELQPGWSVSAGYTQFRVKDAAGADVNTIYPRKLLRLFTAYRLPGAWSALTLGGGVNWQSRTWTGATNPLGAPARIEQDAYALVNLMARYDINAQWTAQLNVSNLLDKKHYGLFDAFDQISYGEPRNVSLSLRYKF